MHIKAWDNTFGNHWNIELVLDKGSKHLRVCVGVRWQKHCSLTPRVPERSPPPCASEEERWLGRGKTSHPLEPIVAQAASRWVSIAGFAKPMPSWTHNINAL